ncbi:MAG: Trigger factor [Deltaproteobacteria bacterium]|jgi:trigger factor|nr:Trigger factor [Deltaproteobacteria bacterium]
MESSVEELGDLKYSIALEIPLEEIKPTYDAVYRELKKTRLNGFRPGKHPKGWLDKRFKSSMQQEAVDRVIPAFMENALEEHSLKPVTVPSIKQMDFDRKSALSATLHFEIAPELAPLDYGKILLVRRDIEEVTATEIAEEQELLMQKEEFLEIKTGDDIEVEVEDGDWVLLDYTATIDGKAFADSKANDLQIRIGSSEYKEFHSSLLGMNSGDEKNAVIELTEIFDENEGENADFRFKLKDIFTVERPEMDEEFFKKYGVSNQDELKENIAEIIKSRKILELQSEYRIEVGAQLSDLYDNFILPEELMKFGKERVDNELEVESAKNEISDEEKEKKRQEGYENARMDLRMKFILDSIREHENLQFDEKEAAGEFFNLAHFTGQSPEELIQTPFGRNMYQRVFIRKQGDATLDRIVARVFGDPIEESTPAEHEHVHDEHCGHDHS